MNVYNLNCDILYTVFFDSDSNSSSKNMNISFTHIFRKHRGSFKFSLFFFFPPLFHLTLSQSDVVAAWAANEVERVFPSCGLTLGMAKPRHLLAVIFVFNFPILPAFYRHEHKKIYMNYRCNMALGIGVCRLG